MMRRIRRSHGADTLAKAEPEPDLADATDFFTLLCAPARPHHVHLVATKEQAQENSYFPLADSTSFYILFPLTPLFSIFVCLHAAAGPFLRLVIRCWWFETMRVIA